jgi:hypothetical protein
MGELSHEAARLLDARRAAVEELRLIDGKARSITDHDVIRLSSARMLTEALTMRLIAGEAIGPADLREADRMVEDALTSAGRRTVTVELKSFGASTACPSCGFTPPKPEEPINKPGEKIVDALRRQKMEREAAAKAHSGGMKASVENNAPQASLSPPDTVVKPVEAKPESKPVEKPYHETHARDSRPDALQSLKDAQSSVVWFTNSKKGVG